MKRSLVLLTLTLAGTLAGSAQTHGTDYFPVQIGNTWIYASYDTLSKRVWAIKDTFRIDGLKYCTYMLGTFADTISSDSLGRIWRYTGGNKFIWFDFALPDSAQYLVPAFGLDPQDSFIVKVSRNIAVETHAGKFTDCILLYFDVPGWSDVQLAYYFAPGVGIVRKLGAWVNDSLYSAVIDGRIISSVGLETGGPGLPQAWNLEQNFPNPFNPITEILFSVLERSHVSLKVYTMLGQEVATLLDRDEEAGYKSVRWNAGTFPSGIYLYRMEAGPFTSIRKLTLIK